MQCLSILVTGPKGPRSFWFVVLYETFYPNNAYTLPGLQMGTNKLLRSPDEMQGMGAFSGQVFFSRVKYPEKEVVGTMSAG